MSKTKVSIILCLIFGLVGLCYTGFVINGSSIPFLNQQFLSNYNIQYQLLPSQKGFTGKIPKWLQERKFIYCLKNRSNKNTVAVVEAKKDGSVILNPRNIFGRSRFNYGPIPESHKLTKSDLDALFGPIVSQKNNQVTYQLITHYPSREKEHEKVAIVDVIFKGDKLFKFRVRGEKLIPTDWVKVQKEGEEVSLESSSSPKS